MFPNKVVPSRNEKNARQDKIQRISERNNISCQVEHKLRTRKSRSVGTVQFGFYNCYLKSCPSRILLEQLNTSRRTFFNQMTCAHYCLRDINRSPVVSADGGPTSRGWEIIGDIAACCSQWHSYIRNISSFLIYYLGIVLSLFAVLSWMDSAAK